jgi:fructose-1,6-bisphosphatase/inositol monophosphatase family enzyme
MQDNDVDYLAIALASARPGGQQILRYFRSSLAVEDKDPGPDYEPVTLADRTAERVMREVILRRFDVRHSAECYGACLLAAGCLDAVIDVNPDAHDVQPLSPIIEAAGGVTTDREGRPCCQGGSILACGDRRLHAHLLRLLA